MTSWVGRTAEGVDSGGRDAGHGRRRGTRRSTTGAAIAGGQRDYRLLPVWIGVAEANAITVEQQRVSLPRPMTHQLIGHVMDAFGRHLEQVQITEIRDNIFYADLILDQHTRVSARQRRRRARPAPGRPYSRRRNRAQHGHRGQQCDPCRRRRPRTRGGLGVPPVPRHRLPRRLRPGLMVAQSSAADQSMITHEAPTRSQTRVVSRGSNPEPADLGAVMLVERGQPR